MNKPQGIIVTIISALLFVSTASTVAAYTPTVTPSTSNAVGILRELNSWLNEDGGIAHINNSLKTGMAKANEWMPNARLQEFTFFYMHGWNPGCHLTFSSVNITDKIAKVDCSMEGAEIKLQEYPTDEKTSGIYVSKLRMRDIVPALLADETFLSLLDQGVLGDQETADITVRFRVYSNRLNRATWQISLSDSVSRKLLKIRTSSASETPSFHFFTGQF